MDTFNINFDLSAKFTYTDFAHGKCGQRKNIYTLLHFIHVGLIEAFNRYGAFPLITLYYLGAAPGRTLDFIAPLFPYINFILVDGTSEGVDWDQEALRRLRTYNNVSIIASNVTSHDFRLATGRVVTNVDRRGTWYDAMSNLDYIDNLSAMMTPIVRAGQQFAMVYNDIRSGIHGMSPRDVSLRCHDELMDSFRYQFPLPGQIEGVHIDVMLHKFRPPYPEVMFNEERHIYENMTIPEGTFYLRPFSGPSSSEVSYITMKAVGQKEPVNTFVSTSVLSDIIFANNQRAKFALFQGIPRYTLHKWDKHKRLELTNRPHPSTDAEAELLTAVRQWGIRGKDADVRKFLLEKVDKLKLICSTLTYSDHE